ncbi:MAG: hypothetical protein ACI4SB_02145, partial [Acutalibacteraceae bacterium]
MTTKEKMSTKIIGDFLRFNFVCLGLLIFFYILLTLAAKQYSDIYNLIYSLLTEFFGDKTGEFR